MILSVCDINEVKEVMKIVKIVISIIRIFVPILLIVFCMIDFMKATSSDNADALKNAGKLAVQRAIAAVLVFLIPTFVSAIFNLLGAKAEYKKCFEKAYLIDNNKTIVTLNK